MDYSYEIHKGYAEVKIFGHADLPVYKEFITALLSNEEFSPGLPVLLDQTELVAGHMTADELMIIAQFCIKLKDSIGSRKVAVHVSRDLEYGLNRMWSAYVDEKWDCQHKLFRSRQEAMDWLKAKVI